MVESTKKPSNKQAYDRYVRSKAAADAKKAAKPLPETLEKKEEIASRAFHACTKNEWKGVRATFPAVQELVNQSHIKTAPADFSVLTKENCKMAGAKGSSDMSEGINTFRFAYTTAEHKRAYFPIVTTEFSSYKLMRSRTLSAQENSLLTGLTEDKVETDVETQDEEENSITEEPVNEDMAELEKLATLASIQNSIQEREEEAEHHKEETNRLENLKDLEELEKMAAKADLEKEHYHPYIEHNHIQKHETQDAETQTDDEDIYGLNDLFREHNDIEDHVTKSDDSNTDEEERRPLLGQDNHDTQLLEPTEEELEEERMNNITPLFSDVEDSVEHNEPVHEDTPVEEKAPVEEEKTTFHDPEHEEYDFFARKNGKNGQLNRAHHLEEEAAEEETHHVQLLGGWSKAQTCSDEEKHNTLAYITKMTLSGKMLGLMPTTQNIMSCAHQIVAGTNFSVIVQINNDICEAVYTVDLENIIHDLDKSYAKREVPCVDMYARHLF